MSKDHFDEVIVFPDPDLKARYESLIGLDGIKERLEKEATILLRPDLIEEWSKKHHDHLLPAVSLLQRRAPLFIFAGDVGTGKTELATTFGDKVARDANLCIELFPLSLRTRGQGSVGEMTQLISAAFKTLRERAPKLPQKGKKALAASILLIDEADALAQSRELAQMHHEDRAGVNALIRGIDDIAASKSLCLIIMCTNRLGSLDPAIQRRAAAIFEFERPDATIRKHLLIAQLENSGLTDEEIGKIAELLGKDKSRPYGCTSSDIMQRFIPSLVLTAFPSNPITYQLAQNLAITFTPTPPFQSQ
jgi:SpoVK/Ycf46/Vps4 family AAA+-type ATPase